MALTGGTPKHKKKYYREKITHKTSKLPREAGNTADWRLQFNASYNFAMGLLTKHSPFFLLTLLSLSLTITT